MPFSNPRHYLHKQHTYLQGRLVIGPISQFAFEFLVFGIKQAWACLFGGLMLSLLVGTYLFYPDDALVVRYDFISIMAVIIQICLLALKLESFEEARVILAFHIVGTVMEVFKTKMGSWGYPEPCLLSVAGVPLFSGFMYACVGSYIARAWRIFDFQFVRFPPLKLQVLLALLVYINFFTHHFVIDIRNALFLGSALLYGPCVLGFKPDETHRPMPLLLGLVLVAIFIWFAENIGTYARAWSYPTQVTGWHMVTIGKLGAWYLLMLISFVLVTTIHRPIVHWSRG